MAVNLVSIRPIGLRPCATGGHRKGTSSSNWWTPLFGWSSEPDYVDPGNRLTLDVDTQSGSDQDPKTLSTRSREMAVSLVSIRPIGLRPCATGGHRKVPT
ncbi:hypothetical protein RHSIM_Rhsim01G0083500 [Rhododendron simsii]|uniref:Uncharacterized protein n=1 Tax=Rhododendron simsii TaxID=118357 RepID=A0A834HJP4_RHOSS|nr:hypothetical protein RHSIM_Rhsim01G0083500 [Rhododendron simsii]